MKHTSFPITHWSEDDRPREKLILKGKTALSDAELIAILIGSGNRNESAVDLSKRILNSVDNNLNTLGKLSLAQLTNFKGIGEAKAIAIIAATELGKRRQSEEITKNPKITSSKLVYDLMHPIISDLYHEEFWVLYLSNSNKVIYKHLISKGGFTSTLVDTRLVFKIALEQNATAIILTHNHPSGTLKPSESDLKITQKLKIAGEQLDVKVLDHIIIAQNSYLSFVDEGIL